MADWTHLDETGQPGMVDVSQKEVTVRKARAVCSVRIGQVVQEALAGGDHLTKKGAVLQTSIIAGTMAAKKTSELIPFCHPLSMDSCKFEVEQEDDLVSFFCECRTTGKTGIEMEALTGVMGAALCFYDMCKALDKGMVIEGGRLLSKEGGKSGNWEAK